MKTGAWVSSVVALMVAGSAAAQQGPKKSFQCWTDDNGVRMCGDQVPPKYAGKQRDIRNEKGVVVDSKAAAITPEERAAQQAEADRKAREAEEQKKKDDYDHTLLEDYRTVGDLQAKRTETVSLIKARIKAAERIKADNEQALKDQQARADAAAKEKVPDDPKAAEKLDKRKKDIAATVARLQKEVDGNGKSLDRMHKELDASEEHFGKDLARYCELKKVPADKCAVEPAASPAPAPAAPVKK